ncbi:MAG: hypothetical protein M1587_01475 [Thaumarchaeota archaeon]|nr:hypothetical protein [Nitrososphaerota archaeon]
MTEDFDGCKNESEQNLEASELSVAQPNYVGAGDRNNKKVVSATDARSNANSKRLSLTLIAGLLVCCLLPIIILSAGVGITSYFLLHGSYLILIFSIFILVLVVIAFIFHNRSVTGRNENRLKEQTAEIDEEKEKEASTPASLAKPEHCSGGELEPN